MRYVKPFVKGVEQVWKLEFGASHLFLFPSPSMDEEPHIDVESASNTTTDDPGCSSSALLMLLAFIDMGFVSLALI
jgi:hypothetical protein